MPLGRLVGTTVFGQLTAWATGLGVGDSQCGYTAIAARAVDALELDALWPGYGYPNDLLSALARRARPPRGRGRRAAGVPRRGERPPRPPPARHLVLDRPRRRAPRPARARPTDRRRGARTIRSTLALAAGLGFLGVALGAFGSRPQAHARVEARRRRSRALVDDGRALPPPPRRRGRPRRRAATAPIAGLLFAAGVALFSGSLYVMTLTGVRKLGAVTPVRRPRDARRVGRARSAARLSTR